MYWIFLNLVIKKESTHWCNHTQETNSNAVMYVLLSSVSCVNSCSCHVDQNILHCFSVENVWVFPMFYEYAVFVCFFISYSTLSHYAHSVQGFMWIHYICISTQWVGHGKIMKFPWGNGGMNRRYIRRCVQVCIYRSDLHQRLGPWSAVCGRNICWELSYSHRTEVDTQRSERSERERVWSKSSLSSLLHSRQGLAHKHTGSVKNCMRKPWSCLTQHAFGIKHSQHKDTYRF